MKQLTSQQFVDGYEQGYISDIVVVGTKIYGKDPRGMADSGKIYDVVWATVP